jgi:hypothetical protein
MTPLTIVAIAFVLSLLLFGFAFWTPIYAIPLAILFLIGMGLAELVRRRSPQRETQRFRDQARNAGPHREAGSTDRERESLYHRP